MTPPAWSTDPNWTPPCPQISAPTPGLFAEAEVPPSPVGAHADAIINAAPAQARARREAASQRWRYAWHRQPNVELVPLDPPHFAGYVREFIPAVPDIHPDHADLLLLLDAGLQRIAYDHIRAFTHPTFPGRRHKRGSMPVQTLRRLSERDWLKLPVRFREAFDPIHTWYNNGCLAYREYQYPVPGPVSPPRAPALGHPSGGSK